MLTIKHIEEDGHESVTSAKAVSFYPKGNPANRPELVAFGVPLPVSDECNRYASGRVYVMNDAGKTVGIYDLT